MAFRQTYAIIGGKKFGSILAGLELYYQGGKNGSSTKVNAVLASLYATFKTRITPVTIGGDFLSGTGSSATIDKSFAPLYGTNHKFYGFMDYFYVGNDHSNSGLLDLYVKTNFKLGEKSSLLGHLHYFSSGVNITDPNNPAENLSSYLGTEIDLVYTLSLAKSVKINIGYSQMFATSSMVEIKGGNGDNTAVNNWVWAMIMFKPTLFESKKQ